MRAARAVVVAGGVADARGFVVFFGREVTPDEFVSRIECEGSDELTLGAAVAFAERVDGVDFAEVVGGSCGEGVGGQAGKMLFGFKCGERVSSEGMRN